MIDSIGTGLENQEVIEMQVAFLDMLPFELASCLFQKGQASSTTA